jgi:hypothetical protein
VAKTKSQSGNYVHQLKSQSGKWALYGDVDAEIIVCGHSHAACILEASNLPESKAGSSIAISVCYSTDLYTAAPPRAGDKDYWEFVVELSRGKHVAVVWNGNQHNANFMFQTQPSFIMLGATEDSTYQEAVPIPRAMIREFFKPSFEELSEIIPSLSNSTSITLMNGPAPKPLTHIQSAVLQEKFFTDIAKSLGVEVGDLVITSDSLRLELWNVLAELLAHSAKKLNANFLGAPTQSRDASGMLLPEYWSPDVTHANSNYGLLLIDELAKLIGKVPN